MCELKDGKISEYDICPEDFGLTRQESLKDLKVENAEQSLAKMTAVLSGEKGACRDIVLMNSAATLYCGGIVDNLQDGVKLAAETIDSGKAFAKQKEFIKLTQSF